MASSPRSVAPFSAARVATALRIPWADLPTTPAALAAATNSVPARLFHDVPCRVTIKARSPVGFGFYGATLLEPRISSGEMVMPSSLVLVSSTRIRIFSRL